MATALQKRRETLPVHGLVLLNKPAGMTSNQALQRVKRLLKARKGGHTGSLDPAATGMLPLCFGEATKVSAYLLDADKSYRVVAKLGESTDTADADGKLISSAAVPELDAERWTEILAGFLGESKQVPPMYSALKKDGKRLYELARQGQVVERAARPIRISQIELLEYHGRRLAFRVSCSKGTYIRTLVEDVAAVAGTLAHTVVLHRETVAGFAAKDMVELAELEELAADGDLEALYAHLLPIDSALQHWPSCALQTADCERFERGQPVSANAEWPLGTLLRVYDGAGRFVGIAESVSESRLAPKRVFNLAP
ncbi:tRNA pseudouridine(55) synthase TruB [Woeseia oceani]|uniref:tRNA pseudouridine synthase B n=1 Tax=Woeseia oceani TaxID=1548547 RepID=A0A193LGK3_9GAMM|nr:tRNA pseudouridine(55) synthase TruB [Woeseia oceani]ANO51494.1 tRNA pseudouridine(55) synthase TruB [Woeseia oceani]